MKRIRKQECKRNHPYVSERDAWNLDDFFSPILCAGLRRFLTLKLEHIPADFKTEEEWKDTIRQVLRKLIAVLSENFTRATIL